MYAYIYMKSEAIHENRLVGICSCVVFSSHNIYIYIEEVCVLIFPFCSARYVEIECDVCCHRGKNRETI